MDDRCLVQGVAVASKHSGGEESFETALGSLLFAGYRISLHLSTKRPSFQPEKGLGGVFGAEIWSVSTDRVCGLSSIQRAMDGYFHSQRVDQVVDAVSRITHVSSILRRKLRGLTSPPCKSRSWKTTACPTLTGAGFIKWSTPFLSKTGLALPSLTTFS